jgi:hypothetical protein
VHAYWQPLLFTSHQTGSFASHYGYSAKNVNAEDEFPLINDSGVWPTGCLIAPYYGRLMPDQVFTPVTPDAGVPPASNSLTNPVGNDAAVRAAPHPADWPWLISRLVT